MKARIFNSLTWSVINLSLAALAFACFNFPRYTSGGLFIIRFVLLILVGDIVLVLRDLWHRSSRGRAIVAILLLLPVLFLFSLMIQWEGRLYVAVEPGPVPKFQVRGLSEFCGLAIYGPEHERPEWPGDDIGLVWGFEWPRHDHWPKSAEFTYGQVPSGFQQTAPAGNAPPPRLDSKVTYTVALGRCMGGPQYGSLRGGLLTDYKVASGMCSGPLKVPERSEPAYVWVDCKTQEPLPMSPRAKERLKAYREKRIVFY